MKPSQNSETKNNTLRKNVNFYQDYLKKKESSKLPVKKSKGIVDISNNVDLFKKKLFQTVNFYQYLYIRKFLLFTKNKNTFD